MIEITEAKRPDIDAIADIRLATQQAHAERLPHRFMSSAAEAHRKIAHTFMPPRRFWRKRYHFAFVAKDERKLLGYVFFFRHLSEGSGMFASSQITTVADIGVLDGYRRQGIGRSLLDKVVVAARAAGSDELNAHVWSGNESSEAFFIKAGFTPEMQLMNFRLSDTDAPEASLSKT